MKSSFNIETLDWQKNNGLIPAIVQDNSSLQVLMCGYMNIESLQETLSKQKVVFYSRTKKRLWMKGETSGNTLDVIKIMADCDNDSLLILASPNGPTCHEGSQSCFKDNHSRNFLGELEKMISKRFDERPENSYTTQLFESGLQRIAQKVGEEAVETILAAVSKNKESTISESADLIYHWCVLMRVCGITLEDVMSELNSRNQSR